jgi:hypothetical protein
MYHLSPLMHVKIHSQVTNGTLMDTNGSESDEDDISVVTAESSVDSEATVLCDVPTVMYLLAQPDNDDDTDSSVVTSASIDSNA